MIEIIKSTVEHAKDIPLWLLFTLLVTGAIFAVFYFRYHIALYRNLYDKTKLQVDRISNYLSGNLASGTDLRQILVDERDEQIYHHVFGYHLERNKRELLVPVVSSEDAPVTWRSIKSAREFIKIENGRLVVRRTGFHRFDYIFKHVMAFLFVVMAGLLGVTVTAQKSWSLRFIGISVFMFFLLGFIFAISSTFGYSTAGRLEKWLSKTKSNEG